MRRSSRDDETLRLRDRAMRAIAQGILITDATQPSLPIVYASPGFEALTGYPAAEVLGRNGRFMQGEATDRDAVARICEALASARTCVEVVLSYRKDGTPFWGEVSISPVRDETGKLTHFVSVLADVTERRRLEERLRHAQKLEGIGRLAGGVAHDFNNLLTVIGGYAEMLLRATPEGDRRRGPLEEIRKAGERATSLTRQLLAFSRNQVVATEPLDLSEVVRDAESLLRGVLGEDVQLATVLASEPDLVQADPGQVQQVVLNLALNARDAMPRGGRLTLETEVVEVSAREVTDPDPGVILVPEGARPGRYLRLTVADTGAGMSDEVKAQLFEPFFTTKPVGAGRGLGLAVVLGIVEQAGGHVEVRSELDAGTSVNVFLPCSARPARPATVSAANGAAPRGSETLLLVEDEPAVRALARLALQDQGYRVLEAAHGEAALHLAAGYPEPIDLLVTDVVMPGLGGRDLAERLVADRPELRVLFMSGYTDDAVVRQGVLTERVHFLRKPFSPTALAHKVRKVLGR